MKRIAMIVIAGSILASATLAQDSAVTLGGINPDPTAPVEITADSLSVDQENGVAVFTGNVVIGQADLRLTAPRVEVIYGETEGQISRLEATGGVTFVTAEAAAEAQQASYDLDGEQLVMTGDVLLTQGASALAADTMTVDLATGAAQMDGRVRTVFQQGGN